VRQETAKAYLRVGFIQQKLGQSERAEQSYNQALALLGALASRYPDELIYKQELARGHHNLSRLQAATGRFCDALASCEMALRLRQRLARDFSNNPELCKDLANSFLRMGNLLKIMERHGEAKEAYRQALQQFEKLAEDSTGPDYQQGVASCLNNLGILMVESGDMVEAEKAHRRAVDLYVDLVKEHPDAPDYQQELAACQINLANLLKKTNRSNEAERVCLEAIDRWEELIEGYPMVPGYKQELADSYHNLGIFYQETGRVSEAEKAFLDSVALYDQLKDDFPNSSKYCRNLATTIYRLALLVRDPHQPIALHQFGPLNGNLRSGGDSKCPGPGKDPMAPAVLGTQAAGHGSRKDKGKKSAELAIRNGTCRACAEANTMPRTNQTRLDMARHYFGRAHDQYVEALRRSDNDAFSQNNLAWFLVTCPDESFRDVDKAVQLAQSVVKIFPGAGTFWNTLGVVHYRRGEWKEAAVALKESIRLHPSGGDSFDWFFLAMAHHRLGDRVQARRFYDKAVEWMEKHQEFVEELTRFRAEAAALMASESGPSNNSGPYKG
jgi:tetratricopeptide (TPR) repeat protein